MESIVQGAVAGLIAALAATTILGLARYARQWWANRQDVKYISELLAEGRTHVMEAIDSLSMVWVQWHQQTVFVLPSTTE